VAVPISKTRFTCVRFEALTPMLLRVLVFWSVTLFQRVSGYWHLWCLYLLILESEGTTSLQHVGELLTLWQSLKSQNTGILRVYWQECYSTKRKAPQP